MRGQEGELVGGQPDRAADRPGAVPDRGLGAQHHRRRRGRGVLQRRSSLRACSGSTRVSDSKVVNSTAGYAVPSTTAVVGRVAEQPAELLGVVGGAVLVVPGPAQPEQLVPDHVQQRRAADDGGGQVGPLGERRTDQQPAVGAAEHAELRRRRPALGDQVLAGGGEVVEHVLLVLAHAGAVPLLAVLGPAAQVGHRPHPAGGDPGQRLRGVAGGQRDVEPAVAVEHRRPRPVRARPSGDSTNRCTAVPSGEVACVSVTTTSPGGTGAGGLLPGRSAPVGGVPAQHRRRRGVVGVADPRRRAALGRRADPGDAARRRAARRRRAVRTPSAAHSDSRSVASHGVHGEHLQVRRPGRRRSATSDRTASGCSGTTSSRPAAPRWPGRPGRRRRAGRAGRPGRRAATAGRRGPPRRRSARRRRPAARRRRPSPARSASQTSSRGAVPARAGDDQPAAVAAMARRRSSWSGPARRPCTSTSVVGSAPDPVAPDPAVELLLAGRAPGPAASRRT